MRPAAFFMVSNFVNFSVYLQDILGNLDQRVDISDTCHISG